MLFRRLALAVSVVIAVAAAPVAHAALPAMLALSAGLHIAAFSGYQYFAAKPEVNVPVLPGKPAAKSEAVIKPDERVPDSRILAVEAVLPASPTFDVPGPYSITFSNSSNQTWTALADNLPELVQQMRYCPSHICDSSHPGRFVREHAADLTSSYTKPFSTLAEYGTTGDHSTHDNFITSNANLARYVIHYPGAGKVLIVEGSGFSCPDGYSFNSSSTDCQRLYQTQKLKSAPGGVHSIDNPSAPTVTSTCPSNTN